MPKDLKKAVLINKFFMTFLEIFENITKKKSFLCIGLDSDIEKIPSDLLKFEDPIFEFNKQIIDATHDLVIAYKPNTAFYEASGAKGWETLHKTAEYIKLNFPDIFLIADAKRGDIGNTSKMYAKAFFETMPFDAITVAPYMGNDSVLPFLDFKNKFVILLSLTSNSGADDFQFIKNSRNSNFLYEDVIETSKNWGNNENLMYVVGATKAKRIEEIRKIIPDNFLLIPGVGAQGGCLSEVIEYGMNKYCGLIVNSSREIIYASNGKDFAIKAREKAKKMQIEMKKYLSEIK
jgi:orotidine-5'-phosphate decarboxylase